MDPAERIKVALARPEAKRQVAPPPALEPPAEVESTLPLLGVSDQTRAFAPIVAPKVETGTVAKTTVATPSAKSGPSRRIYVAFGVFALVVISALVIRQRTAAPPKPASVPSVLQLEVRPEGKGLLNVRWNAQSAPVQRAHEGRLVIVEANQQPKTVPLQAEELKVGHVYYQSSVERLELRLEVVDNAGVVVRESVLALAPGSAEGTSAPAAPQTEQVEAPPVRPQPPPVETAAVERVVTPVPEAPKVSAPAPREFTPPRSTKPKSEEPAEPVLEASTPVATGITAPAHVNLPALSALPAPMAKSAAVKEPASQGTAGGKIEPAVLLRKVAPAYPVIARTARIEGVVLFSATIDKFGKVQNLRVVSGPQMLVQAASEAVRKWAYRPMMVDGRPTEVITQVEVRFSLAK